MKASYEDIRRSVNVEPIWFDENGCPRFAPFHPSLVPNIYADEAALAVIACQNCGHRFKVGICRDSHDLLYLIRKMPVPRLSDDIQRGGINYGDPPNLGCCPAGPTMNSDELCVLEYWTRHNEAREWTRDKTFEVRLADFGEGDDR